MKRDFEPTLPEPTVRMRPERVKPEKPRPAPAPAPKGFAERLALFVTGVDRTRAEELLSGLAGVNEKRAINAARDASRLDSATRQGRMAVAFGNHPKAAERLKELVSRASPTMKIAIFRRLTPWQQSLFPSLKDVVDGEIPPAMEELAERLIREATR